MYTDQYDTQELRVRLLSVSGTEVSGKLMYSAWGLLYYSAASGVRHTARILTN